VALGARPERGGREEEVREKEEEEERKEEGEEGKVEGEEGAEEQLEATVVAGETTREAWEEGGGGGPAAGAVMRREGEARRCCCCCCCSCCCSCSCPCCWDCLLWVGGGGGERGREGGRVKMLHWLVRYAQHTNGKNRHIHRKKRKREPSNLCRPF
jgi:hypothetical protein